MQYSKMLVLNKVLEPINKLKYSLVCSYRFIYLHNLTIGYPCTSEVQPPSSFCGMLHTWCRIISYMFCDFSTGFLSYMIARLILKLWPGMAHSRAM